MIFLGFFKLVILREVGLFIGSIDRFSITVDIEKWGVSSVSTDSVINRLMNDSKHKR